MDINTNRAWIELSSNAFFHNVHQVKGVVGDTLIAAVLKANAYGHGLVEMGLLCDQAASVAFIMVAFLSEALSLRASGVTKPIIILSYSDGDVAHSIDQRIAFVVDSHEEVYALNAAAQRFNTIIDIHVKVNTGLTRRGIDPQDAVSFITFIMQLPSIRMMGICSHFASAYAEDSEVANKQQRIFMSLLSILSYHGIQVPLIHMSNSSCKIIPGCNLLRTGIALYGYKPKPLKMALSPVLCLKTRIMQIRDVAPDTLVGYDSTYRTMCATRLAIVPLGYYDGYDSRFSNVGMMYVRGSYAPVRGRVSMNVTMIDVTHIPDVMVGDEVVVIGDYEGIRAPDLCARAEIRNMRELLSRLNPLLARVIV